MKIEKKVKGFFKENEILLKKEEKWKKEWQNMPEYSQKNLESYRCIYLHFRNQEDINIFSNLIKQKITRKQKSYWFPEEKKGEFKNMQYINKEEI